MKISFGTLAVIIALVLGVFAGHKVATHQPETFTPIDGNIGEYGE